MTPRVVLLRGTAANPWELGPWERLHTDGDLEVTLVVPPDNLYDTSQLKAAGRRCANHRRAHAPGPPGRALLKAVGQRHLGLEQALEGADIVHAAELGYWFSRQAARLKEQLGYRLVLTVWETLPFLDAYRNVRTRRYRRDVLDATDLFLPTTRRAAEALVLEGAPRDRIRVSPPGVDVERFADAPDVAAGRRPARAPLHRTARLGKGPPGPSAGNGAAAAPRCARGLRADRGPWPRGTPPPGGRQGPGPRERAVEFRGFVEHDGIPSLLAGASCLVLASLPTRFWEEQFGMVLAEAMAAGLPIVAAESGAIPEVLDGYGDAVRARGLGRARGRPRTRPSQRGGGHACQC